MACLSTLLLSAITRLHAQYEFTVESKKKLQVIVDHIYFKYKIARQYWVDDLTLSFYHHRHHILRSSILWPRHEAKVMQTGFDSFIQGHDHVVFKFGGYTSLSSKLPTSMQALIHLLHHMKIKFTIALVRVICKIRSSTSRQELKQKWRNAIWAIELHLPKREASKA